MLDLLTPATDEARRLLDETDMRLIFEYERGPWKVVVTHVNLVSGNVDGAIYYDGEYSGNFLRHLNAETGRIVHITYGLKHKRMGFTREYYAHCLDAYRQYGFEQVIVSASGDGRVAWAKFGFEANYEQWQSTLTAAMEQVDTLRRDGAIDSGEATRRRRALRVLMASEPSMLSLLDVPFDAAGERSVLESLNWRGTLTL